MGARAKVICAIAGLVFAAFALLAALVSGFTAPLWVLPLAVVLIGVAIVLP